MINQNQKITLKNRKDQNIIGALEIPHKKPKGTVVIKYLPCKGRPHQSTSL